MRVFIPSLHRPGNVARMQRLAGGADLVWCVVPEERSIYQRAGARFTLATPPRKADKLNAVLDLYGDRWCVFSDDDCRRLRRLRDGVLVDVSLNEVAHHFVRTGERLGVHFVVIPPVTNTRFLHAGVSNWGQAPGWLFAVAPGTAERFDRTLYTGEDSDYAARVFDRYGRIARMNDVTGDYAWGGKASNYAHARDNEHSFQVLCARYPHLYVGYRDETLILADTPRRMERRVRGALRRALTPVAGPRSGASGSP